MDIVSTRSYQTLLELQDSLLAKLDESSSFSAERFANDIDTVIKKIWSRKNTAQNISEALLKMHKITKKIFIQEQGKSIWKKLDKENKSFLKIFQPHLASPEFPAIPINVHSLKPYSTGFFTFPDKRTFPLFYFGKFYGAHHFYLVDEQTLQLPNKTQQLFTYFDSVSSQTLRDLRESFVDLKPEYLAISKKGKWFMQEPKNLAGELSMWLKSQLDSASLISIASQIAGFMFKEKEFGVELFHLNKNFFIQNGKAHPILENQIYQFLEEYESRHEDFLKELNGINPEFASKVKSEYEKLKTGPNENIFNVLKEAYRTGLISKEDLQKTNSMAYQIAYALQAAQEKIGGLIAIPWKKIDSKEDLVIYLNFVIRSKIKKGNLSFQLFTAAKKLIKNIPQIKSGVKEGLRKGPSHLNQKESKFSPPFSNKNPRRSVVGLIDQLLEEIQKCPEAVDPASLDLLWSFVNQKDGKQNKPSRKLLRQILDGVKQRIREKQHENFIHQDLHIRKDLTAILYAIMLEHYSNNDTSLDDFLDDLLEKIKKQLNEDESLKMVGKQIDKGDGVKDSFYDPVRTPGDYFITLFWQDFHDQLRNLFEHKLASDPLGDLACLRVLHAVAPHEKNFIDRQLEKVLKDNYKKMSRQKLEKELKSRFEEFKFNP